MIHSSRDQWQPSGHIWLGRTAGISSCYLFNGKVLGTLHWLGPEGALQCCSVIAMKRLTALMKCIIIRAEEPKLPKLQSVHVMTNECVRSSADTQSKRLPLRDHTTLSHPETLFMRLVEAKTIIRRGDRTKTNNLHIFRFRKYSYN